MQTLKYLVGYPEPVQARVRELIERDQLGAMLREKYSSNHTVCSDRQLYEYTLDLKARYLRQSGPIHKVVYDGRLQVVKHALGTHTTVSRVQGGKLKARSEIRIASVFREAPADLLRMIVVHELAHLREGEHNKAFYQLCTHMAPDYHQLEFDTRLYLTYRDGLQASE